MKKSKTINVPFLQVGTALYSFPMKKSKETKDIKITPIIIDVNSDLVEIDKAEILKLFNLLEITKDKS